MEDIDARALRVIEAIHGVKHFKCRAECFPDIITAIDFWLKTDPKAKIYAPTIIGFPSGRGATFEFYTMTDRKTLHDLWFNSRKDIHRMAETLNNAKWYDGTIIDKGTPVCDLCDGWNHKTADEDAILCIHCYKEETWREECEDCGILMGGKVFTNEDEFDEHPERDVGYDKEGQWRCPVCYDKHKEKQQREEFDAFIENHLFPNEVEIAGRIAFWSKHNDWWRKSQAHYTPAVYGAIKKIYETKFNKDIIKQMGKTLSSYGFQEMSVACSIIKHIAFPNADPEIRLEMSQRMEEGFDGIGDFQR
jgi:hypothetical protein